MKARLILDRRVAISENAFVEMVLWQVPKPLPASLHEYKYRLALVAKGECVLRYDNEAGKGDHVHSGNAELPYVFTNVDRLIADFMSEVSRWSDENHHA